MNPERNSSNRFAIILMLFLGITSCYSQNRVVPVELMRNIIPCLNRNGILVIFERDPEKTGQSGNESTPGKKLIRQAGEAGFESVGINKDLLERDNIYLFRPNK